MMRNRFGIVCAAAVVAACGSAHAQFVGPSTSTVPYVLPSPGFSGSVSTTSILTVGDSIGGYRMVGIPDGLGAMGTDSGFDLFMNHELGTTVGVERAHGNKGAFVSRWSIQNNLLVTSGRDHNQTNTSINLWNGSGFSAGTTAYARLCSADLPSASAFSFGGLGTSERIFMNGEETGAEGRAFGHIVTGPNTGISYELPHLGKFSWENSIANPLAQQKTVVIGTDDTSNQGQVYMYVGNKTNTGSEVDRAGLTNGNLYTLTVDGFTSEDRNNPPADGTRFGFYNHGDVSNQTGAQINTDSVNNGAMNWLRPEDGHWDPRPGFENDFYFLTTDRFNSGSQTGRSRLWRMRYDDITDPTAGGSLDLLLEGTEGQQMMDNMTIDSHGRILIQEDPGNQNLLARIWLYDLGTGAFNEIAAHNGTFFGSGNSNRLTLDEESSGIIDAKDILGDGWFLMDSQAHYSLGGELVEGGQLLALYVDPNFVPTPGAAALLGLAALGAARRRR